MKYVRSIFMFILFTAINSGIIYYKFNNLSIPTVDNFILVYSIYNNILTFAYILTIVIFLVLIITKDHSNETRNKFLAYSLKLRKEYKHFKFTNNFLFRFSSYFFTVSFGFYGLWYLFVVRAINHMLHFIYRAQIKNIVEGE